MYCCFIKRIMDLLLSTVAIFVLFPVWLIIALAIVIDDPGPILFKQKELAKRMAKLHIFYYINFEA